MGDDDTPIFEIRDSNLDSGLRGIPVGTCQTSFVDPIRESTMWAILWRIS